MKEKNLDVSVYLEIFRKMFRWGCLCSQEELGKLGVLSCNAQPMESEVQCKGERISAVPGIPSQLF